MKDYSTITHMSAHLIIQSVVWLFYPTQIYRVTRFSLIAIIRSNYLFPHPSLSLPSSLILHFSQVQNSCFTFILSFPLDSEIQIFVPWPLTPCFQVWAARNSLAEEMPLGWSPLLRKVLPNLNSCNWCQCFPSCLTPKLGAALLSPLIWHCTEHDLKYHASKTSYMNVSIFCPAAGLL